MENRAVMEKMVNTYNEQAFTHEYMFAFNWKKKVVVSLAKSDILSIICKLDKTSSKRGGKYSLRFVPNMAQKEMLMENETFVLCSVEELEQQFATSKYNRGEIVEKMITEHFGQIWHKDNVPYTEDGDIWVDGIPYQIKYTKATFLTA